MIWRFVAVFAHVFYTGVLLKGSKVLSLLVHFPRIPRRVSRFRIAESGAAGFSSCVQELVDPSFGV